MRKSKRILSLLTLLLFCCMSIYAQDKRVVKGIVKDATGETLPGVTVAVKGSTTLGTITDFDGKYSLTIPTDAQTLVASYIGMHALEKAITGDVIDFVLESSDSELDEVVVIGYATVKRRDLTGTVSSVQGDAVRSVPVANVAEALTGKLAGVQITTTEGSPDADMKIRVRGGGSITGDNSPLYIVDGFPVETISDIPSSEIESIDVLKDGSSTAIYGSRGANGVIIITTKGGKAGKLSVNYNAYFGVKEIAKTLDVLNVPDYLKWQYEHALLSSNDGNPERYEKYFGVYEDMDLYSNVKGNNWQDQIFGRTGHVFNHNLSISGGSDKVTYAFNYAHIKDKAIMEGSDFRRDNLSLKLKHQPLKNLTFDYSVRYSNAKIHGGGMNEQNEKSSSDSRMRHAVIYTPLPIKQLDDDSVDDEASASNLVNPYRALTDSERTQTRRTINLAGAVTWKPIKELTLKSDVGIDYYDSTEDRFYGTSTYYVQNNVPEEYKYKPAITLTNGSRKTIRNTNTANYDLKKIFSNKDHSANVLVGQENVLRKQNVLTSDILGFPTTWGANESFTHSSQGSPYYASNYYSPNDVLVSFFGRASYDYKSKYLVSGTFRADGSSKFARGNRWGYFPSAAVAWRISSENFMESTKDWLDDLKLRVSYGTAGNNRIPSGQMAPTFSSSSAQGWIDGFTNYWGPSKTMSNPELKWETTYTRNLGLDFTLINSKLSGSVDAYLNNTKDLLNLYSIAGTGYDNQYRNMGETENKGIEVSLNYTAIDTKNFGLNMGFNIGFNKNKIKNYGGQAQDYETSAWTSAADTKQDYIIRVGGQVGEMYGYKTVGRYEVSDFKEYDGTNWILKDPEAYDSSKELGGKLRPGMMKLQDGEKRVIGNANPTHTGGFTLNGRAYGFDLSAAFNWSVGNDIYNANKIEYTSTGKYSYRNLITKMEDGKRWTNMMPDGTITNDMAQLTTLNANTTMWSPYIQKHVFTDWAVEDGSFLRLNTLTLGYTLPSDLTKKVAIQNLRFYASAYNVFCITSYSGFDPEVSTRRKTNLTPGVDYSAYPKSRQYLFGLNLTF